MDRVDYIKRLNAFCVRYATTLEKRADVETDVERWYRMMLKAEAVLALTIPLGF